jgi:hypothetical protein
MVACLLVAACAASASAAPATPARGVSLTRVELLRSEVAPGGSLRYADGVRNRGRRTVRKGAVGFWLSEDGVRSRSDLLLGKRQIRNLRAGGRSQARRWLKVPASVAPGAYRLIGCVVGVRPRVCRVAKATLRVTAAPFPAAGTPVSVLALRDITPPAVGLTSPPDGSTTRDAKPTFSGPAGTAPGDAATVTVRVFRGTAATGAAERELAAPVDAASATWSVTPPAALSDGVYTVQATQSDAEGNTTTTGSHTFAVDATAPETSLDPSGPTGTTSSTAASFAFSSPDGGATFECKLEDPGSTTVSYGSCTSPKAYSSLADGTYTFSVRARDDAGNTDATPASRTFTVDATAPTVTVVHPANGSTTDQPKPAFDGAAGTADGDVATITVKIFQAGATSGAAFRTLSAPVTGGAWSATPPDVLPEGDYIVRAQQSDSAGNTGASTDHAFTVGPGHLLAAGDIASCDPAVDGDQKTADLLATRLGTVAPLGDEVYGGDEGSLASFNDCYDPNWGVEKGRSKPVPGNHEYRNTVSSVQAAGYFSYFGRAAGEPAKGYYSYDVGSWHVVALNSNCTFVSCAAGDAQETWLRSDLAANPSACTLAYFHHPLFTSDGAAGPATPTRPLWQALQDAKADVILNGHAHQYERFAPQTPDGTAAPDTGIREFVVGTGGKSHTAFGTIRPNSDVRDDTTFGVLDLGLHQGSYDWTFVPVAGSTFTDSGTTACH